MISCIICHHKGEKFVNQCIESIKESRNDEFEIIIVTSAPECKITGANRVVYSNEGPSQKRNIGARYANGQYFAFLDDDVVLDPTCLYEMRKMMEKDGSQCVYAKTLNMERIDHLDCAGSYITWTGFLFAREGHQVIDKGQFDIPDEILSGKGACMMISRRMFYSVGGFDPYYGYLAEETDISWRICLLGGRNSYCYRAIAYHAFNTKFKPIKVYYTNERIYFNGCRNYLVMLTKLLETKNLWKIIPFNMVGWMISGVLMILTGHFQAGYNIYRGIFHYFKDMPKTLQRRRRIQQTRVITDKVLFSRIKKTPPLSYFFGRLVRYIQTGLHG